jgi:uncharacterized membrane protein YfcA
MSSYGAKGTRTPNNRLRCPPDDQPLQMSEFTLAVFIAAVFLLAGGVKGVLGLGLPTVGMGLLSIVMTPAQAAGILVIPALITNIWQVALGPTLLPLVRRFALMIVATVIGTFSTVGFLTTSSGSTATATLGAVLAAYGIYGLVGARLEIRPRWERWLSPFVGFATGMLNGATGIFVLPTAPYLTSLRLDKEELVQIVGINAFICPLALAAALMAHGELRIEVAGSWVVALVCSLAGMYVGQIVRQRTAEQVFRRAFFIGLLALGTYMCLRGLVSFK